MALSTTSAKVASSSYHKNIIIKTDKLSKLYQDDDADDGDDWKESEKRMMVTVIMADWNINTISIIIMSITIMSIIIVSIIIVTI